MRDQQLNLLAAKIAESHCMPMIVAGDLNCTPWSYPFKDFIHGAGLMDSRLNLGIETTWPAAIWPLRMPLDHVLNTPDLDCKQREVEADCGSDHLPVFVRFAASRSGQ